MSRPRASFMLWTALAVSLTGIGAESSCGPTDLIDDPTFDLWCGNTLCNWELEAGSVKAVPTWHVAEDGVAMRGNPTIISQRVETDADSVSCIQFDLVAETGDGSSISLELDFYDDGAPEYVEPIESDGYQLQTVFITPPRYWQDVRFRLSKTGEADVIVAMIRARTAGSSDCTEPPLPGTGLASGLECDVDDECLSGTCSEVPIVSSYDGDLEIDTCGGCADDRDCDDGQVCGLTWGEGWFGWRTCIDPPQRALGEACATGGECGSGVCCSGQCSECCGADSCDDGATCGRHQLGDGDASIDVMAYSCVRLGGERGPGETCIADSDCASGDCSSSSELKICDPDGRPCETDADCPWSELGGHCVTLGPDDGTCG